MRSGRCKVLKVGHDRADMSSMTDLASKGMSPPTTPGPPVRSVPRGPSGARGALARLAAVVALVVLAAIVTHTTDLLIVIVALIVMVMLHELGHFATAKWSRMKVTEYFLGFGPRLWSVRRGETEYGIKAVPAGGYVKIVGMTNAEEVDPDDEPRTYRQQPFHNRLMVAVAGSAMHALIAFVLIWSLLVVVGTPTSSGAQIDAFSPLTHGLDPARVAGLRVGDVVVGVDGHRISSADQMISAVSPRAGQHLTLDVDRRGKTLAIAITPVATRTSSSATSQGRIGVEIADAPGPASRADPVVALGRSVIDFGREVGLSMSGLAVVFSPHGISNYLDALTNSQAAERLSKSGQRIQSIYGAVRTATQGAQAGAQGLIEVLVAINIFVGIFNLLPMLPLDGGHVAVAVYERIRSRRGRRYRADINKLMPVAYAFVLLVGFIVVSSLYLDITHPVANPFH
jgi:membrane-associated protease RseP (regulator of RpoE activity)